ncbi:Uncharacterised protein [Mycobacteroides abscessus subsp. abscessus]|nr:Uncharacterised protein [Mycobacteroides abscessus subsp. abscessus]
MKIVARSGSFLGCVTRVWNVSPGKWAVSAHRMSGVGRGHREIRRRSLAGGAVVRSVPLAEALRNSRGWSPEGPVGQHRPSLVSWSRLRRSHAGSAGLPMGRWPAGSGRSRRRAPGEGGRTAKSARIRRMRGEENDAGTGGVTLPPGTYRHTRELVMR